MMSCYDIEKILGWLQRSISFSFFIIFWVYIYFKMQCRMQCCIQMYFGTIWMVWVPKKVLATLFPDIFHVKTKWNIVYKFLKTKIFSRHKNILSQMHWKSNIFGHSASTNGGFGYHSTIQSLTSRKQYAQHRSGCGTEMRRGK